jgi:epidermal growth factor receptor substrate 15
VTKTLRLGYRDLADINSDGRLTRDGFAIAMYLIHAKLAGKEIPASLPPSLVPPSMRANGVPSSPQRAEPQADLFSWDDTPPVSAALPPAGGISQLQSTGQATQALPFVSSVSQASTLHDPFATSSSSSIPSKL